MKIGTISLNINTHDLNYGAMLHSWAFQKFLMKYKGVETEIIDYTTPNLYGKNLKYPMWGYLKEGRIKSFVVACIRLVSHGKRFEKFEKFKKECLDISEVKYSQEKLAQEQLDYEVVFCESDVIWSPGFFGGDFDPAFFLALPSMTSAKRIAYAASMANAGFSVEQEQHFRVLLQSLDAVSCRETYAAAYTQKFCEKKVECVVDPVLLLKAEEYKTVTAPRMIAEPYLLLYFPLGYDTYIIKAAKKYAAKKHLKLVEISRFPWDKLSHKTILDAGIEEFCL